MKTAIQKLPKSEIKITIELDDDELAKYREKAAASISSRIQIPGFRGGKAPAFTVEAQIGKDAFFQEVLRFALSETYAKAVETEKSPVVSRPKITILSEYPFKYEAIASTMPEVKIKNYKKVKVKVEDEKITDAEVDDVIREMQKYHASYQAHKEAVVKGDRVEIDFEGFDEKGQSVPNTKSKSHPLFVGEGTLVSGFEENLIGMKAGEKKKFEVAFPQDFQHKSFAGRTITFEVEMEKAEKVLLPLLDDVFAEKVYGQKITMAEFREKVREDLKWRAAKEKRERQENLLIEEWLKLAEIDLPQGLIDDEVDFLQGSLRHDLESRKLDFDKYVELLKSKGRDLRKEKEEEAVKRLKVRLIVNELFKLENITANDQEVDFEIEKYVQTQPTDEQAKVREIFKKDPNRRLQILNSIRLRKLFDRFLTET